MLLSARSVDPFAIKEVIETQRNNLLETQLPLKTVIGGGFAVVVVVVGATYAVMNAATSSQIGALETQLESVKRQSERPNAVTTGSGSTIDFSERVDEVVELSSRLAKIEEERNVLVSQLAALSTDSLSPGSELGTLVQQLESDDSNLRRAAATGLFELSDPRSVQSLVDYYWRDRDEASRWILATRYMSFAWYNDRSIGFDFVLRVLQEDNPQHAEWAYEKLHEWARDQEFAESIPAIVDIALRSKESLVRTRAKLILQTHEEWIEFEKELDEKYGSEQ